MIARQASTVDLAEDAIHNAELARLRQETPGLGTYAHFAHGSASLPPTVVYRAWEAWIRAEKSMGAQRAADHLREELQGVKASVARLIHAQPCQIALLDSASRAWSTALSAVLAANAEVHVVTTSDEYGANSLCLLAASTQQRLSYSVMSARASGGTLLERLEKVLAEIAPGRMPVVSLTAVPTAFGGAMDLRGVAACMERRGGLFFLDASHSVGQRNVDVRSIGCDVLVFPARKWLRGPKGVGVLHVSDRALRLLGVPQAVDVAGARWLASAQSTAMPDARRFEGHEFNPGLHLALKAACDYANAIGTPRIERRNRQVRTAVASMLETRLGWTALEARHPEATALMTYRIPESAADAETLVRRLWHAGINASCIGHQHARWALEAIDAKSLLRLTPHYFTNEEEIDRLARAIQIAVSERQE